MVNLYYVVLEQLKNTEKLLFVRTLNARLSNVVFFNYDGMFESLHEKKSVSIR